MNPSTSSVYPLMCGFAEKVRLIVDDQAACVSVNSLETERIKMRSRLFLGLGRPAQRAVGRRDENNKRTIEHMLARREHRIEV